MAQPTIYADIDCDGQVEVKINNDTGYPCTLITSTGVNESIPSTGTDVYRNYNLTSSDWVKVVAAQDATIAANKLTGTIKYVTSVTTTTPTPTTTTTTTPAGGTPFSGGPDCDSAVPWTNFGSANTYAVQGSTGGEWFKLNGPYTGRTIYITNATGGTNVGIEFQTFDACTLLEAKNKTTWDAGVLINDLGGSVASNTNLNFHFQTPGTWNVYIV